MGCKLRVLMPPARQKADESNSLLAATWLQMPEVCLTRAPAEGLLKRLSLHAKRVQAQMHILKKQDMLCRNGQTTLSSWKRFYMF